jgi:DNA-binding response OmpR family regulator
MIRTSLKYPDTSSQNMDGAQQSHWWTFRPIKLYLRFIENLQRQSHEILVKRISEERIALRENRSEAVIARRPANEEASAYAAKREEILMKRKSILIVDDEKNIRLTLSQALEVLEVDIDMAENGEEALAKLKEKEFSLILLDLRMPGISGMEVLRQVREIRPDILVIIITAHGTVESAIEAMKLGACDFLQKPFVPDEIRELVSRVMDREKIDEQKTLDYDSSIELAKRSINKRNLNAAIEHIRKAISFDPGRPEGFNLFGIVIEMRGDSLEAQKNYRAALSLDPSYKPALENLSRSTAWQPRQKGHAFLGLKE